MADLTRVQLDFLEKHLKIPMVFGRKEAKERRDLWAQEFRDFNQRRDAVADQVDRIQDSTVRQLLTNHIADAEATIMRKTKLPDFSGALSQLDGVEHSAGLQVLHEECTTQIARLRPLVDEVLKTDPVNLTDIQLRWNYVQEKAAEGRAASNPGSMHSALAAVSGLETALRNAEPAEADAPTHTAVDAAKRALENEAEMRAPRAALDEEVKRFAELRGRLTSGFSLGVPPALSGQFGPIDTALNVAEDAAPGVVTAAAGLAKGLIDTLENAAKPQLEAFARYDDARGKLEGGGFAVLSAHRAAANPLLAPALVSITARIKAAATAAQAHEYDTACDEIEEATTACREAVNRADALIEFIDLKDDREVRINEMKAAVPDPAPHPATQAARDEAMRKWTEVTAAFDSKKLEQIKGCAGILEKLPADVDDTKRIHKLATRFLGKFNPIKNHAAYYEGRITGFEEAEKNAIARLIGDFKTLLVDCGFDKTKSIEVSSTLADRAHSMAVLIHGKISEVENFKTSKTQFEARLNEMAAVEADRTGEPILDYLARLRAEQTHANSRIAQTDFAMAKRVYDGSAKVHGEKKQLLGYAKSYFDDMDWLDTNIPQVQGMDGNAAAADEIQNALQRKAEAQVAKTGRDWPAAAALAAAAKARVEAGRANAKAAKAMEDKKNAATTALGEMGTDKKPIIDAVNKMLGVLRVRVAEDVHFQQLSKQPIQLAKQGLAKLKEGPDKLGEAQALMQQSMDAAERGLAIYSKVEPHKAELATVEAEKKALDDDKAKGWACGTALDAELTAAAQAIQDAKTAADFSRLDMATAGTKLKEASVALAFVRKSKDAANTAFKNKTEIEKILADVGNAWGRAKEPAAVQALITDKATLDQDLLARSFLTAGKDSAELIKRAKGVQSLATQHYWYDDNVTKVLNPALTGLPGTQVYSGDIRTRIAAMQTQVTDLAGAGGYEAANRIIYQIKNLAQYCSDLERDGPLYEGAKLAAKTALESMEKRIDSKNDVLLAKFQDLRVDFTEAERVATGLHFGKARARMEAISDALAKPELEQDIADYAAYLKARESAGEGMAKIGKFPQKGPIEPLVTRIFGKHANAVQVADGSDFKTARTMFEDLAQDCNAALLAAEAHAKHGELISDLKELADEDDDGLETALRRAEGFIEPLRSDADALFIFAEIGNATKLLGEARGLAGENPAGARDKLVEVMDICTAAQMKKGHYTQLRQSAEYAEQTIRDLLKPPAPGGFVRDRLEPLLTSIDAAMYAVRQDPGKRTDAEKAVEDALAAFHPLRLIAQDQVDVEALVAEITPRIALMEKHTHRYAIAEDIASVRTALASAKEASDKHDTTRALDLLRRARDRQTDALMRAKLLAGETPDQDDLKALLAAEGGAERLDTLVDGLDPKAQRKIMEDVFKARFGTELHIFKDSEFQDTKLEEFLRANSSASVPEIDEAKRTMKPKDFLAFLEKNSTADEQAIKDKKQELVDLDDITPDKFVERELKKFTDSNPGASEDDISNRRSQLQTQAASLNYDDAPDAKAPNIRRFYKLMSKLPETDTLDNESLGLFTLKKGRQTAPFYSGGSKQVVMNGEESSSPYMTAGLASELGEVDDDVKPEPGEKLTLFSWNTLHEVGHAVDDKLGFMDRRGGELGGWQQHGADVKPIADLIAAKYDFDPDYVTAYMAGNANPEIPDAPSGVEDYEWELRRANARAHVDAIRADAQPWQSAQGAKMSELGDRCYHEAYGGGRSWFSYPAAARKKGVSGYQFRAPGEWFSELYAAYHSGKMNGSHPARDWLETL